MMLRHGGISVMRTLGRRGVRILLYHRFPAAIKTSLEAQCAHLRRHYHLVSLDQVAAWLRDGESLPANSLAVTVDDGYRDFYFTAYPLFSAYKIPVTIFLATDFLDHHSWLWVDRVNFACRHTRVRSARIPLAANETVEFAFGSLEQREESIIAIKARAKRMSNDQRLRLVVEDLPRLLKVAVPDRATEEYEPLRWDEVREMAANNIDFGAHTRTHPILSSVSDHKSLVEEIEVSRKRIEQELDKPVPHFSYPNGTWDDINSQVVDTVKNGGFRTAVVAQGGVNFRDADPFLLRRNTVAPESSEMVFARFATGFLRK
jgi:peptidoglycan/xylan/chitin deacetylase (PgdA/CDA1 family)